jgi:hypothetical protein
VGPVTRADLRKRFTFTIKTRGFNVIASSLLDSCILGVTRLVRERKSRKPSLLFRLVEPFLKENRQTKTALLQILETNYLHRDHVVPSANGGLWDEQQLAQFNAMKENERPQLRRGVLAPR